MTSSWNCFNTDSEQPDALTTNGSLAWTEMSFWRHVAASCINNCLYGNWRCCQERNFDRNDVYAPVVPTSGEAFDENSVKMTPMGCIVWTGSCDNHVKGKYKQIKLQLQQWLFDTTYKLLYTCDLKKIYKQIFSNEQLNDPFNIRGRLRMYSNRLRRIHHSMLRPCFNYC